MVYYASECEWGDVACVRAGYRHPYLHRGGLASLISITNRVIRDKGE